MAENDEDRTVPPEGDPERDGAQTDADLARGTNLGRYVVLQRIGSGGMGVVYAAYDSGLDRKVALKLLRPDVSGEQAAARQSRLLREAKAMAQLNHPNVNTVHDVGAFQGRVFVAMELVDGLTLTRWLAERRRSWDQVVEVFLQAGRGLAAAHRAGLVHRDVKPDNLLLGGDGRIRVTDFGLVRSGAGQEDVLPSAPDGARDLDRSLTRTGALMGSPAYMAPEQHQHERATPKTDQYAFSVTLYEALAGQRPFSGDTIEELTGNVLRGRVAFPEKSDVPAWIRQVVLRGLKRDPDERFGSMDDLLQALGSDPRHKRRRVLMGVGVALLLAVAAWGALQGVLGGETRCAGVDRHLVDVWDAGHKAPIRAAFLSTGAPYARDVWRQTERGLDAYTAAWVAHRTRACEATHVHGEQSPEQLDLRMHCLDRRLQSVKALTALLVEADADVVKNAVQAVGKLGTLDVCADPELLTARLPVPDDPEVRARVEAIEKQLAAIQALADAGKFKDALPLAQRAASEADEVDHRPVQAEAYFLLGKVQGGAGDFKAAEPSLWKAVRSAEAGRHDELGARAWNELVTVIGVRLARHQDGDRWAEHARAAVERLGSEELGADLAHRLGMLRFKQGRYEDALKSQRNSRTTLQKLFGADDHRVAAPMAAEAAALRRLGRQQDSIQIHQRALDIRLRALGAMHPEAAASYGSKAIAHNDAGQPDQALALNKKALAIWEKALGEEHPSTARELSNMGYTLSLLGRYDEALQALERAMRIKKKVHEPGHPTFASTHFNIAYNAYFAKQYRRSYTNYAAAETIWTKNIGNSHRKTTGAILGKAEALGKLGRLDEAIRECERANRLREQALGKDHFAVSETLLGLGLLHLEREDPKKAHDAFERSLTLMRNAEAGPAALAQVHFGLARALWEVGKDRSRAVNLARQARAGYEKMGKGAEQDLAEIDAWLAARNEGPTARPDGGTQ